MITANAQRGAVLIVALVFTAILTVIGVGAMQNATLQERMAGNNKDINVAFQAAEAAIREAEAAMPGLSSADFDGANWMYLSCPDPSDSRQACSEPDWKTKASTGWAVVGEKVDDVSRQPEFIIEQISAMTDPNAALDSDNTVSLLGFYRVTARGFGLSDRSMVVLSTTYKRVEN